MEELYNDLREAFKKAYDKRVKELSQERDKCVEEAKEATDFGRIRSLVERVEAIENMGVLLNKAYGAIDINTTSFWRFLEKLEDDIKFKEFYI